MAKGAAGLNLGRMCEGIANEVHHVLVGEAIEDVRAGAATFDQTFASQQS
jgi:hypothetical protein